MLNKPFHEGIKDSVYQKQMELIESTIVEHGIWLISELDWEVNW